MSLEYKDIDLAQGAGSAAVHHHAPQDAQKQGMPLTFSDVSSAGMPVRGAIKLRASPAVRVITLCDVQE